MVDILSTSPADKYGLFIQLFSSLTTERTESTLDYNSHFLNHTYPAHSYGQFKITN